jgi:hypothetical protein
MRTTSDPTRTWILLGPQHESALFATVGSDAAFLAAPLRQVLYPYNAADPAPTTWHHSIVWQKFNSLATLEQTIKLGGIASNVQVIAYDNEGGKFPDGSWWTPPAEWQKCSPVCAVDNDLVVASMKQFAADVRAIGRSVAFMPGADLWGLTSPDKYIGYINSSVALRTASFADYYHIQSQGLELKLEPSSSNPDFGQFITKLQAQVRAGQRASGRVIVTAGLATEAEPLGRTAVHRATSGNLTVVEPQDIYRAVKSTSTIVDGYWPNLVEDDQTEESVLTNAITLLSALSPAP